MLLVSACNAMLQYRTAPLLQCEFQYTHHLNRRCSFCNNLLSAKNNQKSQQHCKRKLLLKLKIKNLMIITSNTKGKFSTVHSLEHMHSFASPTSACVAQNRTDTIRKKMILCLVQEVSFQLRCEIKSKLVTVHLMPW